MAQGQWRFKLGTGGQQFAAHRLSQGVLKRQGAAVVSFASRHFQRRLPVQAQTQAGGNHHDRRHANGQGSDHGDAHRHAQSDGLGDRLGHVGHALAQPFAGAQATDRQQTFPVAGIAAALEAVGAHAVRPCPVRITAAHAAHTVAALRAGMWLALRFGGVFDGFQGLGHVTARVGH